MENNSLMSKRMLFEHKEILFSDRCLIVEGFNDYKFFSAYLRYLKYQYTDDPRYNIVIINTGGKGSAFHLVNFIKHLKIKCKFIFDFDMVKYTKNIKYSMDQFDKFIKKKYKNDIQEMQKILEISKEFTESGKILCREKQRVKDVNNMNDLKEKYSSVLFKNAGKLEQINTYLENVCYDNIEFKTNEFCEIFEYAILIWDDEIKDLEYFGRTLFGNNFTKKKWGITLYVIFSMN